jgi:hypothetical protein
VLFDTLDGRRSRVSTGPSTGAALITGPIGIIGVLVTGLAGRPGRVALGRERAQR